MSLKLVFAVSNFAFAKANYKKRKLRHSIFHLQEMKNLLKSIFCLMTDAFS
ncbi:hypothetical protein NMS_2395 [Nonlabens marinus S1-08]|uniref:Uncharacterized protein n=1 Tax=Nonlabens marinus S1-08 TaxID=1454201 RepID=W8VRP5_9FLAO|nr:hypothetical protein NMS_2395 [Nonlabens marinus S1-08]